MYEINDTATYLKRVQRWLNVNESGHFDAKTRNAVMKFQRESGLEVDGRVDFVTFSRLSKKHRASELGKMLAVEKYTPFFGRGDFGEEVTDFNNELRLALDGYTHEYPVPSGGIYDERSERAMLRLKEIYGSGSTAFGEGEFLLRMLRENFTKKKAYR